MGHDYYEAIEDRAAKQAAGAQDQRPRPLDVAGKELAVLRERIMQLTERLEPVLLPEGPEKEPSPAEIRQVRSQFAERLDDLCHAIHSAGRMVSALTERIDL